MSFKRPHLTQWLYCPSETPSRNIRIFSGRFLVFSRNFDNWVNTISSSSAMISLPVSDDDQSRTTTNSHSTFLQSHARQEADVVAGGGGDSNGDGRLDRASLGGRVTDVGPHHHGLLVQLRLAKNMTRRLRTYHILREVDLVRDATKLS